MRCGIVFTKYAARLLAVIEADDDADVVTDTFSALPPVRGPRAKAETSSLGILIRWVLLLVLVPASVGAIVLSTMTYRLHRTTAYARVTGFLGVDPRLAEEIGSGAELGWWILGRIDADHESGTALFVVPVSGSEGLGRVGLTLIKAYGRWEVASAGFIWPSGREVVLAGNGWTAGENVPPCPRDIAVFRFTAEELLMRGEDFNPGSGEFSEKPLANARPRQPEDVPDELPTPDRRPLYRKLSAEEVARLLPSENVRLGDEPPFWREQKLLTESQERLWLQGAPLRPTDLALRRGKAGKRRAAGYVAAAWLDGVAGYEEASLEWIQAHTPLVMYFRADWCPQCLAFERHTLKAPRVREALDRMVKVRVNPENSDAERRLADAWRVEGYPAVLVLPSGSKDPVPVRTHDRDPGGILSFPKWLLLPADEFLDHLKEAVAP
jgi:hypothetical protein